MKKVTKYFAAIAALILVSFSSFYNPTVNEAIYVSPSGNDSSDGSLATPLKTLMSAVEKSRKLNIKKIFLRGGSYYDVNISFLPTDANLVIKNYNDEHPVLYAGVMSGNLTKAGKYFVADVKGTANRDWDFRMIMVDGVMRPLARYPSEGTFAYKNQWNQKTLAATQGLWAKKPTPRDYDGLKYNSADFKSLDPRNAEIVLYHSWNESYVGVKNIDTTNKVIYFSNPSTYPLGAYLDQTPNANRYVVYNVVQGMTSPGNWYLNRSEEKLYYWPLLSDNIRSTRIFLPKYHTMFNLGNAGIKNISIDGVEIKGCSNRLQNENFAALTIDAAISGSNVSNIVLKNLKINDNGGSAINLSGNNNTLENINVISTYGGGVYINGRNNILSNSEVKNIGLFFKSAVGIYEDGFHNRIFRVNVDNVSYSGISIRGVGSDVEGCRVSNAMQSLNDGSAIYCALHDSITIKNNTVVGHKGSKIGIYFDEKSHNCLGESNRIMGFLTPIHCNLATNIKIFNNVIIADCLVQTISFQNSTNVQFENNILLSNDISLDYHSDVNNITLGLVRNNYFGTLGQTATVPPNSVTTTKYNSLRAYNHFISLSTGQLRKLSDKIENNSITYGQLKGIFIDSKSGPKKFNY